MRVQYRWPILGALIVLLFAIASSTWHHTIEAPVSSVAGTRNPPAPFTSPAPAPRQSDTEAILPGPSEEDSPRSARGSGYIWGRALNAVYAVSTLSPDGKRNLNLTELKKSFEGFDRPVNLEEASALPQARAEYFASVMTAALSLGAGHQAELAGVLQGYYSSDWQRRELAQAEQTNERSRLSGAAREELATLLPREAQGQFQEMFASPDFLFRSMSVSADEITLDIGQGTALATGNAVLTVDPNGAVRIESSGSSFQQKKNR